MSVIIKGMDFPTKENFMAQLYLICDKDGNWYAVDTINKALYKLIEVKEPHGRLIDADETIRIWDGATFKGSIKPLIDARPTVIEAEGREE